MGAGEKNTAIPFHQVLRAIAMVHVKIHNRHTRQPMVLQRMFGRQGHIAKKTKTHRCFALAVMARRPGCNEDIARFTAHHHIHRPNRTTRRAQSRCKRTWRHMGIRIQTAPPLLRRRGAQSGNMTLWMTPKQIIIRSQGRRHRLQTQRRECLQNMLQTRHLFGMTLRVHMVQAVIMGDYFCAHNAYLCSRTNIYPAPRTVCK